MNTTNELAAEIKKYSRICFYPSSGTDMSNIDYFTSGRKPQEERINQDTSTEGDFTDIPDLFIHTDVNFYYEFESGEDFEFDECGFHGKAEIISFRELPQIKNANRIYDNFDHTGKCFEYKLKLRDSERITTLIYCLCENEFMVSEILLPSSIEVSYVWCRNWNGGRTAGTWLANILGKLNTQKIYTDWLCVPGFRGQPANKRVSDSYPELMKPADVKLIRNESRHWIEEGAHGWVEEFDVKKASIL